MGWGIREADKCRDLHLCISKVIYTHIWWYVAETSKKRWFLNPEGLPNHHNDYLMGGSALLFLNSEGEFIISQEIRGHYFTLIFLFPATALFLHKAKFKALEIINPKVALCSQGKPRGTQSLTITVVTLGKRSLLGLLLLPTHMRQKCLEPRHHAEH